MNPSDNQDNQNSDEKRPQIIDVAPPNQANDTTDDSASDDQMQAQTFEPTMPASQPIEVMEAPEEAVEQPAEEVRQPEEVVPENTEDDIQINHDGSVVSAGAEDQSEPENSPEAEPEQSFNAPPMDTVVPSPPQVDEPVVTEEASSVSPDGMAVVGAAAAVAATQPEKPKKKVSVLPIIIALIVACALAGLTVYAYQKQQSDKNASTSQDSSNNGGATQDSSTTSETTQPTISDVDEAAKAAEDALTSDDATDTSETELNDTTLGL